MAVEHQVDGDGTVGEVLEFAVIGIDEVAVAVGGAGVDGDCAVRQGADVHAVDAVAAVGADGHTIDVQHSAGAVGEGQGDVAARGDIGGGAADIGGLAVEHQVDGDRTGQCVEGCIIGSVGRVAGGVGYAGGDDQVAICQAAEVFGDAVAAIGDGCGGGGDRVTIGVGDRQGHGAACADIGGSRDRRISDVAVVHVIQADSDVDCGVEGKSQAAARRSVAGDVSLAYQNRVVAFQSHRWSCAPGRAVGAVFDGGARLNTANAVGAVVGDQIAGDTAVDQQDQGRG